MKILLVEDDSNTATMLTKALAAHHYLVEVANDGQTGLDMAKTYDYNLILLDAIVPELDGFNLCRQLRRDGDRTPILMLTAKGTSKDRVMGLEAGADDYVVKPFDLSELIARMRALLRRGNEILPQLLTWENLQLDLGSGEVTYNGTLLRLTPKERGLLELFLNNPRRIFSRAVILDRVWSANEFPGEEAVRTQIMGLRQKLKSVGMKADLIKTVYGLGYRLNDPLEGEREGERERGRGEAEGAGGAGGAGEVGLRPLQVGSRKSEVESNNIQSGDVGTQRLRPNETETMGDLALVWDRYKQGLGEQLALFDRAIACLSNGNCDLQLCQQARSIAHRLIGSLGTFGLPQGSDLARQIEYWFERCDRLSPQEIGQLTRSNASLRQLIDGEPQATNDAKLSFVGNGTRLLVVACDRVLLAQIETTKRDRGWQIESVTNPTDAINAIARRLPDAILLDLDCATTEEDALAFLAELARQYPSLPIVAISDRDRLANRVEVARLGGRAFLPKPVPVDRILATITDAIEQSRGTEATILIVDDDRDLLTALAAMLEPWGMRAIGLEDPRQFWHVLETTNPDLLVLDVEMPEYSGFDLCQAVRADWRWAGIPILILSAHRDAETVRQVFAVGADDYASKPIVDAELVARLLNRLERVRMQKRKDFNSDDKTRRYY